MTVRGGRIHICNCFSGSGDGGGTVRYSPVQSGTVRSKLILTPA